MAFSDVLEQIQGFDVNDVDWERAGVWPLPIKVIICVLVAVVIFCGVFFLGIEDLNLEKSKAAAEEIELRASFEDKSFQASNLDGYRLQMVDMEKSFGALVSQLPSDTEVPGLLEDIDEKGTESNLIIDSIDLKPETLKEFYVELPIDIRVKGGYHDLGAFVSGVAGMPRIVTLHDFSITKNKNDGALEMKIAAKTYRYKSQDDDDE